MNRILWITPANGYSEKMRPALDRMLRKQNISPANCMYVNPHLICKNMLIPAGKKQESKTKMVPNWDIGHEVYRELDRHVKLCNPKIIVCNDWASLCFIVGNVVSLNAARGSVYVYGEKRIPVIVLDELYKVFVMKDGPWIFQNDLGKIARWLNDKQRSEPKFKYTVIRTLEELHAAERDICTSEFVSIDCETRRGYLTCIGYTYLRGRELHTVVVPFLNPLRDDNAHWPSAEIECQVWLSIRRIHASPGVKILQNGTYDCAYFVRYRVPLFNYMLDTANCFHSIWTEAQKKLNFIGSICLDYVKYWKDELKGSKEENFPNNETRLHRYWRYNALDCYYTFLSACVVFPTLARLPWAVVNYAQEFADNTGPAFAMSMRGMKLRKDRQKIKTDLRMIAHEKELARLRVMCDEPRFNPNSSDQICQLLYDVLGAIPIKQKGKNKSKNERTADEKVLALVAQQHPLFDRYIRQIWDTKKPLAWVSKYGTPYEENKKIKGLETYNDRFMYGLSAGGTDTWRYASREHMFWLGTNAQNIPVVDRDMFVVDPGYVFFEADYSQSDAWFVAHECEDENFIKTMTSGLDTHCVHAAHFFKKSYEEIYAAYKADFEWCTHYLRGVRNVTKRASHGANYQMAAFTLYVQMTREPCIAAALALGMSNPHLWTEKQVLTFIDRFLLESYYTLYPGLKKWFTSGPEEAVKNGNKVTTAFGKTRLFFGDIMADKAIQRKISAQYGQAGTAGNINRVLRKIFYQSDFETKYRMLMFLQVHDSVLFMVPIRHIAMCQKILDIMQEKFKIKGRELAVPADAKVGLSWGKDGKGNPMMKYREDISYAEILEHEKQFVAKRYPQMIESEAYYRLA